MKKINPSLFGHIGVLYGGISKEREVSLWSGKAIYDALVSMGINATLFDVDNNFLDIIKTKPFDFAFIALHGRGGEDGQIQSILDWVNIPYTGSSVSASAIAMNKVFTKKIWQSEGLPVLPQVVMDDNFIADDIVDKLGFPIAIKPALEGSSIGISKVTTKEELKSAYKKARIYDSVIMAEKWIDGREFTGTILGNKVLPIIEVITSKGFYDYQTKYITGATEYRCPCSIPTDQEKELQQIMLKAADTIGVSVWSRVDVVIDQNNQPWLLEINTVPGMTKNSLVPKSAKQAGISFEQLITEVLNLSREN